MVFNFHSGNAGGIFPIQRPRQLLLGFQMERGDVTKDQSLSIILLIQKSQDQILQVLRGAGAGNQKQLKFSNTTRSGLSFISPPMEVELHTAPNR